MTSVVTHSDRQGGLFLFTIFFSVLVCHYYHLAGLSLYLSRTEFTEKNFQINYVTFFFFPFLVLYNNGSCIVWETHIAVGCFFHPKFCRAFLSFSSVSVYTLFEAK